MGSAVSAIFLMENINANKLDKILSIGIYRVGSYFADN